jgi:subtilisin family serine protease
LPAIPTDEAPTRHRAADLLCSRFDSGTSAATPVAAGVGALLMSALASIAPEALKEALTGSACNLGRSIGWDPDTGHGVINAAAAYAYLRDRAALVA